MVRNLHKPTSLKDFLAFLETCGLQSRYTFLGTPCKRDADAPSGIAFVNFLSPEDVEKLHRLLNQRMWNSFIQYAVGKIPALSYARFQGHNQCVKSLLPLAPSDKRSPLFFRPEDIIPKNLPEAALEYKREAAGRVAIGWPREPEEVPVAVGGELAQIPLPRFAEASASSMACGSQGAAGRGAGFKAESSEV